MTTFVVSLLALLAQTPSDQATVSSAECRFAVRGLAETPQVTGPADVTQRVRIFPQPDSPIAITAIDFTGTVLVAGQGFYEWTGPHEIEVQNVSDQPIQHADVMVQLRHPIDSGIGRGSKIRDVLLPGQRLRLTARSGRGRGHGQFQPEEIVFQAFTQRVTIGGCDYRPALAIPRGR